MQKNTARDEKYKSNAKDPPGRKALCAGVGKHPLLMLLMKLLKSLIRKSAMQSASSAPGNMLINAYLIEARLQKCKQYMDC